MEILTIPPELVSKEGKLELDYYLCEPTRAYKLWYEAASLHRVGLPGPEIRVRTAFDETLFQLMLANFSDHEQAS